MGDLIGKVPLGITDMMIDTKQSVEYIFKTLEIFLTRLIKKTQKNILISFDPCSHMMKGNKRSAVTKRPDEFCQFGTKYEEAVLMKNKP